MRVSRWDFQDESFKMRVSRWEFQDETFMLSHWTQVAPNHLVWRRRSFATISPTHFLQFVALAGCVFLRHISHFALPGQCVWLKRVHVTGSIYIHKIFHIYLYIIHVYVYTFFYIYIYICACLCLCMYTIYTTLISRSARFCERRCIMHHAFCIMHHASAGANHLGMVWELFGSVLGEVRPR